MLRRALELCDRHADVRTILAALAASVVLGVIPLSYAVARIGAGGQGGAGARRGAGAAGAYIDAAARGVVSSLSRGTSSDRDADDCADRSRAGVRGQSVDA